MRTLITLLLLILHPAIGVAAEERIVQGPEIISLLANQTVNGDSFEQSFGDPTGHDNASTTYWEGKNASFGRWRIEGDEYCSQWPPSEFWTCYKVATYVAGAKTFVVWIGSDGTRFVGHIKIKQKP